VTPWCEAALAMPLSVKRCVLPSLRAVGATVLVEVGEVRADVVAESIASRRGRRTAVSMAEAQLIGGEPGSKQIQAHVRHRRAVDVGRCDAVGGHGGAASTP